MTQSNDDGLDHEVIADLNELCRDTGDDVISALLRIFFDEMPQRLSAMREFARDSNLTELSCAAHRLKGSAASIGARRLAGICAALESSGALLASQSALEGLLGELETEANRLHQVLPTALGRADAFRVQTSGSHRY